MKVLVLIHNNIKYDTRVKRHVEAIAEVAEVHVLARPEPNYDFGLQNEKVSYSYFEYKPQPYPITSSIRAFGEKWGILDKFFRCFPILESDTYGDLAVVEHYTNVLNSYIAGARWNQITHRKSERMSIQDALSYPLSFMEIIVQYAEEASKIEADVVLCNDIDTLLCGVVHKMKYGSRLIYDVHDIYSDIGKEQFPQMYSNFLTLFDKEFIVYADLIMSVTESMLRWELEHYNCNAPGIVMLNCSDTSNSEKVYPKKYSNDQRLKIYFHGSSGKDRGLWELVEAVSKFPQFDIVFRCLPSENYSEIHEKVIEYYMEDRVQYLDLVVPDAIPKSANADGDIGYDLCYPDECINYNLTLPNKFIEYTKAALPIISSRTLERTRIIEKYHCGFMLEENTTKGVEQVLQFILDNRNNLEEYSKNSLHTSMEEFDWEKYKEILQAVILNKADILKEKYIRTTKCKDIANRVKYALQDFKSKNKDKLE